MTFLPSCLNPPLSSSPHTHTHTHYPPLQLLGRNASPVDLMAVGMIDQVAETRVMIESTVNASMHTFVHACAVCMSHTCVCTTGISVCAWLFACVNSLNIRVRVAVALQQWRHQDTWHHTDVTQHSTLQDASDSLTWKMRHRREHQQAGRKLNHASAHCCTCFPQNSICNVVLLWKPEIETQITRGRAQIHLHSQRGLCYRCVSSSQIWPHWTLTNFIQRRGNS